MANNILVKIRPIMGLKYGLVKDFDEVVLVKIRPIMGLKYTKTNNKR